MNVYIFSTTSTLSAGSTGSQARLIQSSHQPASYHPVLVKDIGKQHSSPSLRTTERKEVNVTISPEHKVKVVKSYSGGNINRERSPDKCLNGTYFENKDCVTKVIIHKSPRKSSLKTSKGSIERDLSPRGSVDKGKTLKNNNGRARSPRGSIDRDRSPKNIDRDRSPKNIDRDRSPKNIDRDRSPKNIDRDRSPKNIDRDRSPKNINRDRSPKSIERDRSPKNIERDRSPKNIEKDKSPKSCLSRDRSPMQSVERDRSPRGNDRCKSPKNFERGKSPRCSFERSPQASIDRSRSPNERSKSPNVDRSKSPSKPILRKGIMRVKSPQVSTERSPNKSPNLARKYSKSSQDRLAKLGTNSLDRASQYSPMSGYEDKAYKLGIVVSKSTESIAKVMERPTCVQCYLTNKKQNLNS